MKFFCSCNYSGISSVDSELAFVFRTLWDLFKNHFNYIISMDCNARTIKEIWNVYRIVAKTCFSNKTHFIIIHTCKWHYKSETFPEYDTCTKHWSNSWCLIHACEHFYTFEENCNPQKAILLYITVFLIFPGGVWPCVYLWLIQCYVAVVYGGYKIISI